MSKKSKKVKRKIRRTKKRYSKNLRKYMKSKKNRKTKKGGSLLTRQLGEDNPDLLLVRDAISRTPHNTSLLNDEDKKAKLRALLRRELVDGEELTAEENAWVNAMIEARVDLYRRVRSDILDTIDDQQPARRRQRKAEELAEFEAAEAIYPGLSAPMAVAARVTEAEARAAAEAIYPGLSAEEREARLRALLRRQLVDGEELTAEENAWVNAMIGAHGDLYRRTADEVISVHTRAATAEVAALDALLLSLETARREREAALRAREGQTLRSFLEGRTRRRTGRQGQTLRSFLEGRAGRRASSGEIE